MKLPRAIRLDPSDTFIFTRAAEPGEWAVSGAFLFTGCDPDDMGPKERHAFRAGFLGVGTLGFSTEMSWPWGPLVAQNPHIRKRPSVQR